MVQAPGSCRWFTVDLSHEQEANLCGYKPLRLWGCMLPQQNLAYSNRYSIFSKTYPPCTRPIPSALHRTFALLEESSSRGLSMVASASYFSTYLSSSHNPAYLSLSTKSNNSNHGLKQYSFNNRCLLL